MKLVAMVLACLALAALADRISRQCQIEEGTRVICRCMGDEEFLLPEGYNYENVSSLQVSSCTRANLHFSSLVEATEIQEIIVQNISDRLTFELFLRANKIRTLKLAGIRLIPLITSYAFVKIREIDEFHIANTRIANFEGQFTDTIVRDFTLVNVSIGRMDRMSFPGQGRHLRIVESEFQNVSDTLNFSFFAEVEVARSRFTLSKPGHLLIEGDTIRVEGNVFTNASTNLVAASRILVNGSCADGKSSLRISSDRVVSVNNRLPTEIIYTGGKKHFSSAGSLNRNNTVCIAGNCRCPKTNDQDCLQMSGWRIILHTNLVVILLWALP